MATLPELAAEPVPVPGNGHPREVGNRSVPREHGHLWVLLDGTPAHVPPGRLVCNDDGELACHLCGQFFTHLGSHLRRHGWTAADYREAVGLALHVPLCSTRLSGQIAARQRGNWDSDPQMRSRLEPGWLLARSGELSRIAADAIRARETAGRTPPAVRAARARQLAEGRAALAARQQARLDRALTAGGVADLRELLRTRYATGASLDHLARLTGLGRARIRAELIAGGVRIRPTGVNSSPSKHARATRNDQRVAARVGTDDIRGWLRSQRGNGATLRMLAEQTRTSIPWIQSRLAGRASITDRG